MNNLLPEFCFSKTYTDDNIIIIVNGVEGYYPIKTSNGKSIDELNSIIGVTSIEEEAMSTGSMFGFDVPGADPTTYKDYKLKETDTNEPIVYEVLLDNVLDENFGDYVKCEAYWVGKTESEVKAMINVLSEVYPSLKQGNPWLEWGSYEFARFLNAGKCVGIPYMSLRKKTNDNKCPLCGSSFKDYEAALSRRDNKTEICSSCGVKEAMQDYTGSR